MRIRTITLNNVRRFTDPARVAGIGDGLNVLCEPNEHGKSTLFDAIQALFFKPHGSRDREVTSLRPHAGGAPEVTVDIETEDGRFTITKRWLQKPVSTVHKAGTLIAQADAAEAWIADLRDLEAPEAVEERRRKLEAAECAPVIERHFAQQQEKRDRMTPEERTDVFR